VTHKSRGALCRANVPTLSCAARPACRSRSGTTAAATNELRSAGAICGRRDAATLAVHGGGVGGGPKAGRDSFSAKLL
jgi:hypothetical protein